jgi:hypothetical protein
MSPPPVSSGLTVFGAEPLMPWRRLAGSEESAFFELFNA